MAMLTVNGTLKHPANRFGANEPCIGAQVQIWELDAGDGNDDLVFEATSDGDGRFSGSTSRDWYDPPRFGIDLPNFQIVIHQGEHVHHAPLPPPLPRLLEVPPIVVPWQPKEHVLPFGECAADKVSGLLLKRDKVDYQWAHPDDLAGLAVCKRVPPQELPNSRYNNGRLQLLGRLNDNSRRVKNQWFSDPFDHLDDFGKMFISLPPPATAQRPTAADDDDEFARQRLQGVCPLVIALVDKPLDFTVPPTALQGLVPPMNSIDEAIQNRRLFICDYRELAPPDVDLFGHLFLPVPTALFYLADSSPGHRNALVPIAIKIDGQPSAPVVLRRTAAPDVWRNAKLMVQVADAHLHELKFHLWGAHFAFEPWIVAMHRNLRDCHPLKALLGRHMFGVLHNNNIGRHTLTAPRGQIEKLMSPRLDASIAIMAAVAGRHRVDEAGFVRQLELRKVLDTSVLPEYPYRDDGLLVWNAIHSFVNSYVQHYYGDDGRLRADRQWRAMLDDVTSDHGGKLQSLPTGVQESLPVLVNLVTQLVFASSAYHAAVNYPQWEYLAFVPNMPLSSLAAPLHADGTATDLMDMLPTRDMTSQQVGLFWQLTSYRHDALGHYADSFLDPVAEQLARDFRTALQAVDDQIDNRNLSRRVPYDYLKPKNIPNSASV